VATNSHLGSRMRLRRTALGMSRRKLAEALGLSHEQVRKYETGANIVRASRLYAIAIALDVSVSFFFETASPATDERSPAYFDLGAAPVTRKEISALLQAYYAIPTQ
jgi:transcriptional regulator with XRE-family HTH domain